MAIARRASPNPTRKPVNQPSPPAQTSSTRDLPPPPAWQPKGGAPYPWSQGAVGMPGASQQVGTPDDWAKWYPTEGHGRGDAWMSNKMDLRRSQEVAQPGQPDLFISANDRKRAQSDPAFARLHPEALTGNAADRITQPQFAPRAPTDKYSPEYQDWIQKYGMYSAGGPSMPMIRPGVWGSEGTGGDEPTGPAHDTLINALRLHGIQPGPLNTIGGRPGDAGYWTGKQVVKPGQGGQAAQPGPQLDEAAAAKLRNSMKTGQTVTQDGRKYFRNANGALVDVTDPSARKRVTNRQGGYLLSTPTGTVQGVQGRQSIGQQPPATGNQGTRPVNQPGAVNPPTGIPPRGTPPPTQQQPPPTYQPSWQVPYPMPMYAGDNFMGRGFYGGGGGFGPVQLPFTGGPQNMMWY